jgi:hypothetical protein
MQTKQLTWRLDGKTIELGRDWSGQGPKVLLLPALTFRQRFGSKTDIQPISRDVRFTPESGHWQVRL